MMNALMINLFHREIFGGEAILTTNKILNRVPHRKTQSIPYKLWKGRKPNLTYFKVWRCLAKLEVPLPKRVIIGPKIINCVFIGYAVNSKACRFLVHKSDDPEIHVNTIIESDNAEFFENIYPYKTESESTSERPKRPREESMENILTSEEPRRSTRQRKSISFGPDFVALLLENEPQTFKAAMSSS